MSAIAQPNATLYVKNIDWKIKKPLLRRALYSLFTRHGKVLEVITLRREGLRGQAFVIYNDVQSATAALQKEQGFTFFGKDLMLEYAREKSDRIAKRDGTYVPKAKRKKAVAAAAAETTNTPADAPMDAAGDASDAAAASSEPTAQPSRILFAKDLPDECNEMMLSMLFRQYAGFKEVRMPRPGLAFVEFEDEPRAALALQGLNGFNLTNKDQLKLTYDEFAEAIVAPKSWVNGIHTVNPNDNNLPDLS
ncbi:U2 small nuclear ribonucleoprotein B [Seminavis robusta]|uniref:U2 small nuclear ribonucleoprotein B n=1 Tax=Seminavis robusta TaxID=568900 RepID=A0A9N8HBU5_9STRA|nr:U2 small nuclear ribonucleoprotein B [Seminavis robusta]|eukprot:Sro196_g083430.1 U2 small nuclear ribonucleoprotein B (249) ;mRNA; r:23940-24969